MIFWTMVKYKVMTGGNIAARNTKYSTVGDRNTYKNLIFAFNKIHSSAWSSSNATGSLITGLWVTVCTLELAHQAPAVSSSTHGDH